jgi:hypothetical protein
MFGSGWSQATVVLFGAASTEITAHEESDAPRSQDSVTGGAGGPAVSQPCSAMISGPEFFLDLRKARLWPSRPRDRMTTGRNRAAVR